MKTKQIMVINELLNGHTITQACKNSHVSRKTYYQWLEDPEFTEELTSRKNAVLTESVQYLRSKFKTATEALVNIIEADDIPPQVKINAVGEFFRTYKALSEEDCNQRLDELERKIAGLENAEKAN